VKPVLVYDGDCRFCKRWVSRWQARTGERVEYAPYQDPGVLSRLGIPLAAARRSVQLAMPDGTVYEGAEAVFRVISIAPGPHVVARLGRLPMVRWFAERFYRFVANHRVLASRVDRVLFRRAREVALR
jgi:lipase maturation factor 1